MIPGTSEAPHSQRGDLKGCATNEADQDLGSKLCLKRFRQDTNKNRRDEPMKVMAKKYQFLKTPSDMFKFLSRRWQFNELKIWAKTNALKTSV